MVCKKHAIIVLIYFFLNIFLYSFCKFSKQINFILSAGHVMFLSPFFKTVYLKLSLYKFNHHALGSTQSNYHYDYTYNSKRVNKIGLCCIQTSEPNKNLFVHLFTFTQTCSVFVKTHSVELTVFNLRFTYPCGYNSDF